MLPTLIKDLAGTSAPNAANMPRRDYAGTERRIRWWQKRVRLRAEDASNGKSVWRNADARTRKPNARPGLLTECAHPILTWKILCQKPALSLAISADFMERNHHGCQARSPLKTLESSTEITSCNWELWNHFSLDLVKLHSFLFIRSCYFFLRLSVFIFTAIWGSNCS